MARTRTRPSTRPPASRAARSRTPWTRRLRRLVRPETVGGALVVTAAAILVYLLPIDSVPVTDLLDRARDGFVEWFGVHVFTLIALLAALGGLVAARRLHRLRDHWRHLLGAALLLVFSSGVLGLWRPDVQIGGVGLDAVSAGGEAGRWLTSSLLAGLGWAATAVAGFTLLWPRTSARIARSTPRASVDATRWVWQHGPRQALAGLVAGIKRLGQSDVPNAAELQALRARRARGAANGTAVAAPAASVDDPTEEATAPEDLGSPDDDTAGDEDEPARPAVQIPMDMEHDAATWRHSSDGWQLPPMDLLRKAEPATPAADRRHARLVRRRRRRHAGQRGACRHAVRG